MSGNFEITTSSTPANGSRRRITFGIALLIVVFAAIFGMRWMIYSHSHVTTDDAQIDADIYPVSPRVGGHVLQSHIVENQRVNAEQLLVVIDPQDYEIALAQAQAALAQARNSANAATGTVSVTAQTGAAGISQAAAQVAAAHASEVMMEQQSVTAADQIAAARADEAGAGAAVEVARRGIDAARANLASAKARAVQTQRDAERIDSLAASGAASAQQRDAAVAANQSAQAAADAAQAQVASAQAALTQAQQRRHQMAVAVQQSVARAAAAKAQVGQTQAGIHAADAALRSAQSSPVQTGVRASEARSAQGRATQAQAALDQAKLNLTYTRIAAPVAGVIAQKNVEPGQYVTPGQPLAAVVADGSNHVTANFKETDLGRISIGQKATFTVDAYPGVTFTGRVESISPGTGAIFSLLPPENASGNFTKVVQRIPVRITIDQTSETTRYPLRAGMSVVAAVETR